MKTHYENSMKFICVWKPTCTVIPCSGRHDADNVPLAVLALVLASVLRFHGSRCVELEQSKPMRTSGVKPVRIVQGLKRCEDILRFVHVSRRAPN